MKPVLVGMNNPYGADPQYALYPLPERATGWRIWQILREARPGVSMSEYRDAFDRRNLVTGPWSVITARANAAAVRVDLRGRQVVFFGAPVRDAFRLPKQPYGSLAREQLDAESGCDPFTYAHWLPHPSGLNPWYNDASNRVVASDLLGRLYDGERGLLTLRGGIFR